MTATISYKRFGQYLFESLDLDPLYCILVDSGMPEKQMKRWLLAYWIYYSAGVSSFISEVDNPKEFYSLLLKGDDEKWPHGHERRHMRAQTLHKTVACLESYGPPEKVVDRMIAGRTFENHTKIVSQFYGFGQWIAFKIYDMMERVLCIDTDINNVNLFIYRDPVKGAALWEFGDQNHAITPAELGDVISALLKMFRDYLAPPFLDRPLSPMEIETVLCKAKSNYNGHYPLGNDVIDIQHGLPGWGDTAQHLERLLAPYYAMWEDWPWEARNVRVEI